MMEAWWRAVTPHVDIREGRVNEGLFDAKLAQVAHGEGPQEYRDTRLFLAKTYFTQGLRELLTQVLRRVSGDALVNGVLWLQTGFGGGKSHSELTVYHTLTHPAEAAEVEDIATIMKALGLAAPPSAKVAVLSGTNLNPLGRTTADSTRIRTLWGEVAYQLGGAEAFSMVADNDAALQSCGDDLLTRLLRKVGPCAILFDETLHYVDKVKTIGASGSNLAEQTVAFLRELTDAVNAVPGAAMVVSLTASREDMLSDEAPRWLERLNEHVLRNATTFRPVQRNEIHEVVRRRLFEHVSQQQAAATAVAYRQLYAALGGLPADKTGDAYERLVAASYPFHPELISVLYERWGARMGFQETRDTLRFLAFTLQEQWARRTELSDALIQCQDVDLRHGELRGMARRVSADEQWESVIGTDIASQSGSEPAKAQLLDREHNWPRLAEGLATTVLLYSLGRVQGPVVTREELRLACSRPSVPEPLWEDILTSFKSRLFYFYWEEAQYEFRKEPNVLSLQATYRTNLKAEEVDVHLRSVIQRNLLGDKSSGHRFSVYFAPESNQVVPDDESLKLIVLEPDRTVTDGVPSDTTRETCLDLLTRRGDVLRLNRNLLIFCAIDADGVVRARQAAEDYLSWGKIQRNSAEWDRIGGAQQRIVKERMENTSAEVIRGLAGAYSWLLLPTEARDSSTGNVSFDIRRTSPYGPGKNIATMAWERLTSVAGTGQAILAELTPEALIDTYQQNAWPLTELSVTTRGLWERFCRQLALPVLRDQDVLLDTLRVGQQQGLFAIGRLVGENSPPSARDSYVALYCGKTDVPSQDLPQTGERWVALRKSLYEELSKVPTHVSTTELLQAVDAVDGAGHPASVAAVYAYVAKGRDAGIDGGSFVRAVRELVGNNQYAYSAAPGGESTVVPDNLEALQEGWLVRRDGPPPPPPTGRTIKVAATLNDVKLLTSLFTSILRPLDSQNPDAFTLIISATATWENDPGGGLTAALDDGKNNPQLRGIVAVTDSKVK